MELNREKLKRMFNDTKGNGGGSGIGGGGGGIASVALRLANKRLLWGQEFDGSDDVNGDITMDDGSRIFNSTGSGGSIYIGRSDDAGWVKISDMCSRQGDSAWKLKSNGDAVFANVKSNGYIAALSDIRMKKVLDQFTLDLDKIAGASLIRYQRKDTESKQVFVGGIAQEWKEILPEAVFEDATGTLSMSYGVISFAAAMSLARTVKDQQKKIDELEARLAKLEKMFAITGEEGE